LKQPAAAQTDVRNVAALASNENPLAETGLLLAILAIEIKLGSAKSRDILLRTLRSVDVLFKFKGGKQHFDGYILRYDPQRSDHWTTDANGKRVMNPEFLWDMFGNWIYSTPVDDDRLQGKVDRFARAFEPSMDELSGLMAGYMTAHRLVNDPQIRKLIE